MVFSLTSILSPVNVLAISPKSNCQNDTIIENCKNNYLMKYGNGDCCQDKNCIICSCISSCNTEKIVYSTCLMSLVNKIDDFNKGNENVYQSYVLTKETPSPQTS